MIALLPMSSVASISTRMSKDTKARRTDFGALRQRSPLRFDGYRAIYALGPPVAGPVRIATSIEPAAEVVRHRAGLGRGNLVLHVVRWLPALLVRPIADQINTTLTKAGRAMGDRWFDVPPSKAIEVVSWAIAQSDHRRRAKSHEEMVAAHQEAHEEEVRRIMNGC